MTEPAGQGGARIIDRGYQHYPGTRLGSPWLTWAILRAAMARGIGRRRSVGAKVVPILALGAANIPVLVVLAFHLLTRGSGAIPSFSELEAGSSFVISLLFAAVAGPDLLCAERRERVLSLIFASPITRVQYALAKVAGIAVLLLALTLLPLLLLFVGDALLASSTAAYVRDNLRVLGELLLAGVLLALYCAGLVAAVSTFTDRRVYAGGAFVGLLLISGVIGSYLGTAVQFPHHEDFVFLDLYNLGPRTVRWLFEQPPMEASTGAYAQGAMGLSGWAFLGVLLGVTAVALAWLVYQYRRLSD